MTFFVQPVGEKKIFHTPTLPAKLQVHEHLPASNYSLKCTDKGEFFYEPIDAFTLPATMYGDVEKQRDRILRTFLNRPTSTGVMLAGEQGSGKTLLAKALSVEAASLYGAPTIVINEPWRGESFNTLVQQIKQPCVILFDEFEKVYDNEEQEELLTLLDGVYPSKKLFILTCNDKWRVHRHMRNRPGRIFYYLEFGTLDVAFVKEYAQKNLYNKAHLPSVMFLANAFIDLNFDMLKALIEEMNRFDEPAHEAIKMLNARPEFGSEQLYDVKLMKGDMEYPKDLANMQVWKGNPTSARIDIYYRENKTQRWEDSLAFTPDHLKLADNGNFMYEQNGFSLWLTRAKEPKFEYRDDL